LKYGNKKARKAKHLSELVLDTVPKPLSGACELRPGDIPCNLCGVRRSNVLCSFGCCLRCCEKHPERCAYCNHNITKEENIRTIPTTTGTQTYSSSRAFGTSLHNIHNTHSFRLATYNSYKVKAFLKELGLDCYTNIFDDNGFETIESLAALTDNMLIQMGISLLGHRAALLHACKML
jgi:hypothetical protein